MAYIHNMANPTPPPNNYIYFQILIQLKTHNKPIISFIKTGKYEYRNKTINSPKTQKAVMRIYCSLGSFFVVAVNFEQPLPPPSLLSCRPAQVIPYPIASVRVTCRKLSVCQFHLDISNLSHSVWCQFEFGLSFAVRCFI